MSKHYRKDKTCLNCGHTVEEKYCSRCGQENLDTHESFAHLVSHYTADYLHFDSKFFRTLFPLLFRPGKLTREYMAGRRTQYVHPFRLYIFITIVFYIVNGLLSHHGEPSFTRVDDGDSSRQVVYLNGDTTQGERISFSFPELKNIKTVEQYNAYLDSLPPEEKHGWARRYVFSKLVPYGEQPVEFAKKIVEKFQKNLPKLFFILLPVFALLVMLAYRRRKKFYVEHAIFSVHVHSFFFILLLILVILQAIFGNEISLVAAVISLVYLFIALKQAYGGRMGTTFLRWLTIISLYGIVLVVCLLGNLAIAFMML